MSAIGTQSPATAYRGRLVSALRLVGIDRPVAYTLLARIWTVLTGPLTILFISRFLRRDEQGFYYTFGSILGLQIFFELGLGYVLLQCVSHEKASLEWTARGKLEGNAVAKQRLAGLLRMALKWYGVGAVLVVAALLPAGLQFFSRLGGQTAIVAWRVPWVWLAVATGLTFFVNPLFAFLEGGGLVAEVAFVRLVGAMLSTLSLWVALSKGWALFANPIVCTVGLIWCAGWLIWRRKSYFLDLLAKPVGAAIHWRTDVWPFQWRIAVSWLSGYFIFQLFNPVLFAFHGPVVAGQMGMSLSIAAALQSTGGAWVSTKVAPFGTLVARKQFQALDRLFFAALCQSLIVLGLGCASLYSLVLFLNRIQHPLAGRILAPLPMGLLLIAMLANHLVFCESYYLRAHKKEPLLFLSVFGACLITVATYTFGKYFGALGVTSAYSLITVVSTVFVTTAIFIPKRREWHRA